MKLLCAAALVLGPAVSASASPTTFNYQGQLSGAAEHASGRYDLKLCLATGSKSGCQEFAAVPVSDGEFSVKLDFGPDSFEKSDHAISIAYRAAGSTAPYTLSDTQSFVSMPAECGKQECTYVDRTSAKNTGPLTRPTITTLTTDSTNPANKENYDSGEFSSIAVGPDGNPQIGFYAKNRVNDMTSVPLRWEGDTRFVRCNDPACQTFVVGYIQNDESPDPLNPLATGNTRDSGRYIQTAFSATGKVLYAYYDGAGFNGADVRNAATSLCDRAFCTRAAQLESNVGEDVGEYTSLAMSPANNLPVLAYYNSSSQSLRVVRCPTEDCTGVPGDGPGDIDGPDPAVRIADDNPAADVGKWTSITLNAANVAMVSYYDATNGNLKFVSCTAASCTTPVTVDGAQAGDPNVGLYTDIAMGANGFPIISYYDATNAALKVASCTNAGCSAATVTTIDDPATADVGHYTSIVVPGDGLPVISYIDVTNKALKLAKCSTPNCTGTTTLTPIDSGQVADGVTAITFGADTYPVMTYSVIDPVSGKRQLRVAKANTPDGVLEVFFRDSFE